jgi:septal ring factor EnvC (AmiA/AmiB activator)
VSALAKTKEHAQHSGNIQDISDALQALANLQALHDAGMEQVSRLEADLTEARNKIEELEEETKAVRIDRNQLQALNAELEDDLATAKGVRKGETEDLVRARSLIACGNSKEALFVLERVLSIRDAAWRTLPASPSPSAQLDLFDNQHAMAI